MKINANTAQNRFEFFPVFVCAIDRVNTTQHGNVALTGNPARGRAEERGSIDLFKRMLAFLLLISPPQKALNPQQNHHVLRAHRNKLRYGFPALNRKQIAYN